MERIVPPLVVPTPCHAEWAAMSGDNRRRFCAECGKHVYNLSAMSEREAQSFAEKTQGRECVAYLRTDDGLMETLNFFERLLLRFAGWKPAIATLFAAILPAALSACASRPAKNPPLPGKVRAPGHAQSGGSCDAPLNVRSDARMTPGVPLPPNL